MKYIEFWYNRNMKEIKAEKERKRDRETEGKKDREIVRHVWKHAFKLCEQLPNTGYTDEWTNEWTNDQTNKQTNERTNKKEKNKICNASVIDAKYVNAFKERTNSNRSVTQRDKDKQVLIKKMIKLNFYLTKRERFETAILCIEHVYLYWKFFDLLPNLFRISIRYF